MVAAARRRAAGERGDGDGDRVQVARQDQRARGGGRQDVGQEQGQARVQQCEGQAHPERNQSCQSAEGGQGREGGEGAARAEGAAAAGARQRQGGVFLFDGDGAAPLRARVVRLLRARGLKVTTTLRPVDSAEQYREMADTLKLAAFLDGEASEDGDQASVTVHVRSGISGLRVASATLSGERRKLAGEVDKSLWAQLGTPLAHVCDDAAKPRKHEREPMRIEAGTPLPNHPSDRAKDGGKEDHKEEHDPKVRPPSASAAPG